MSQITRSHLRYNEISRSTPKYTYLSSHLQHYPFVGLYWSRPINILLVHKTCNLGSYRLSSYLLIVSWVQFLVSRGRVIMRNEPAHEIMILITYANSEGSGEPGHPLSLTTAFTVRTHKVWRLTKVPKIRHLVPLDACTCTFREWVYGGRKVP